MLHFSRLKILGIALTVLIGAVLIVPNFFSKEALKSWPSWMPGRQIVLGLDLQGGAHMLIQVDQKKLITGRLSELRGEVRALLRKDRIGYSNLGIRQAENSVVARLRDATQVEKARTALRPLTQPVAGNLLSGGSFSEADLTIDDKGSIKLTLTAPGIQNRLSSAVEKSIEVLRRRIDGLGTTEPTLQRQGNDRILLQVPGLKDSERLKVLIGSTAKLSFHLVDESMSAEEAAKNRPPAGTRVIYGQDDPTRPYIIEENPLVSGEDLVDAQPAFDQQSNQPVVNFRFNTKGARRFGKATSENVRRLFAIVLDNEVISAPVINEPILGGSGQISGNFTVEGANDLAVLLRAGALPAKLDIIEQREVGPSLGADSIEAGKVAGMIGAVAVLTFMLLAYGLFGIFANLALTANIILLMGVLSLLGATLTLPGIAGIVLTVGMAVDANVLIYERIREERRVGRAAIAAIDSGFKRALGTILDANITTLIAAVILFSLGSGPIRGFAVTLAIGIATTVFSAFTLTRLFVALWVKAKRPTTLPI